MKYWFSRRSVPWLVVLVMAPPSAALSASSSTKSKTTSSWSNSAVEAARQLSISQREKLLADPTSTEQRSLRELLIEAQLLDVSKPEMWMREEEKKDDDVLVTKIVHFQRHGQGYHNLLGDILRDAGLKPSVDSPDPAINPWLRPEIVDSPLTETGKEQCQQQCELASQLAPELVVVSPLLRAIQTARISFGHLYDQPGIPWLAHEGCREELGVLVCNKRRPLSQIKEEFPSIQFDSDMEEEDILWNPDERESNADKSNRIYEFLANFLAQREEKEIAVIGHSATLFHMCNAVMDCGSDQNLQSWFLTSEIRSMKITFRRQNKAG